MDLKINQKGAAQAAIAIAAAVITSLGFFAGYALSGQGTAALNNVFAAVQPDRLTPPFGDGADWQNSDSDDDYGIISADRQRHEELEAWEHAYKAGRISREAYLAKRQELYNAAG
jgi:hypothetical protein